VYSNAALSSHFSYSAHADAGCAVVLDIKVSDRD
jgi:hypothetical protein